VQLKDPMLAPTVPVAADALAGAENEAVGPVDLVVTSRVDDGDQVIVWEASVPYGIAVPVEP
jgi:hypothetical protein